MRNITNQPVISILFLLAAPIAGLALGVGLGFLLGLNGTDTGNFIANLVFLLVVFMVIPVFGFSSDELGLKLHKSKLIFHIASSLAIFTGYLLFYLFVIQISGFKPVNSSMIWGLVTYLVVVVAEELFFRGEVYGFVEKRYSAKWALVISSVLFGLFHTRQGLLGIITKTITGMLWGSVRYTTDMIYLLIIPVHFGFNATWLLFEGNWNTLPDWAIYAVSAGELFLTVLILFANPDRNRSAKQMTLL
jgi:membrane protease YdiL (CAAX protease family)